MMIMVVVLLMICYTAAAAADYDADACHLITLSPQLGRQWHVAPPERLPQGHHSSI
jgi:hypothetical protein